MVAAGLAVVGVGIAILWPQMQTTRSISLVDAIVIQLVLEVFVVAIVIAAMPRLSGFSLRELGFRALRGSDLVWAALGAVAMIVVVQGLSAGIESAFHQQHEQAIVEQFRELHAPLLIWFFAGFAAVVAPIAEETIFRVFLFNAVMRYAGFWPGAIVSGIIFGAVHGDKFAFVPLAVGGMILAYVYYRSGNAFTSMITHGIFNAVTVIALEFAPKLAQ